MDTIVIKNFIIYKNNINYIKSYDVFRGFYMYCIDVYFINKEKLTIITDSNDEFKCWIDLFK